MKGRFYPYAGATNPTAYEHHNNCTDPDQRLEAFMWAKAPIEGKQVLDIGAGSGFHAVRYAQKADQVFAVEPDARMLQQIYTRLCDNPLGNISVLAASAESMPLLDHSIDVAYARFAYFFGTKDCLCGLREVKRILSPGGHFFIIDANPDQGQFGMIARQVYPHIFHDGYRAEHTAFYQQHGFSHFDLQTVFRAPNRQVLEVYLRMDYPHKYVELLDQIEGTELSYTMSVYHFQKRASMSK
jgi:ubiquinone/menaquinone biosynthesis C-methylase UbiE